MTLIQALILKRPFIRRMLKIPTPAPVPALAALADTSVNPNPTFRDSWNLLRKQFSPESETFKRAQKWQQSSSAAKNQIKAVTVERREGLKEGTGLMVEMIKEEGVEGVVLPQKSRGNVTRSEESQKGKASVFSTREQARQARISLARERRARL